MIKVEKNQMTDIADLFKGVEDSMVMACIQGHMGKAFADTLPNPTMAVIISGEYSFFGGNAKAEAARDAVENIFDYIKGNSTVAIYAEDNLPWRDLLLTISKNNPVEVFRYGMVQKDNKFDRDELKSFVDSMPEGFEMIRFDEKRYDQAMNEAWSMEFCETFASADDYLANGFGFGAIFQGALVSGASTMTVYDGGIEIQVATKENFRRRRLAMPCAAALILECMNRGMRPCWDAATLTSKHMALKLGYEYQGEYSTVHMHLD